MSDLIWTPSTHVKARYGSVCPGGQWFPGAYWSASLAKTVISRFSETLSKQRGYRGVTDVDT